MEKMDVYKRGGRPWLITNIDDLAERIGKNLTLPVNFIYYEAML